MSRIIQIVIAKEKNASLVTSASSDKGRAGNRVTMFGSGMVIDYRCDLTFYQGLSIDIQTAKLLGPYSLLPVLESATLTELADDECSNSPSPLHLLTSTLAAIWILPMIPEQNILAFVSL